MFMHRSLGIADRKALAYGTHDCPYAPWQKTYTNQSPIQVWTACSV